MKPGLIESAVRNSGGWARALVGAALIAGGAVEEARAGSCTLPAWGVASPLELAAQGLAVTTAGGFVYAAGGVGGGMILDHFRRYDPVGNSWTSLAPLPTPVTSSNLVYDAASNRLFLFGGWLGDTAISNQVQVYDIGTNTWSAGPALPANRWLMGSGVIGTKMYLVGGYSTFFVNSSVSTNWEFDPVAGTYTTRAVLPASLGGPGAAVSGGWLYIMGGRNIADAALETNYMYDPVGNSWATLAPLPTGVNAPGSVALSASGGCNGDIILIGGGNPFLTAEVVPLRPDAMETTDVTQIYNVSTDTWSSGPPLSTPRVFTAAAQVADVLIAAGGHDGVSLLQTVERIQGPPLPVELGGFRVE